MQENFKRRMDHHGEGLRGSRDRVVIKNLMMNSVLMMPPKISPLIIGTPKDNLRDRAERG